MGRWNSVVHATVPCRIPAPVTQASAVLPGFSPQSGHLLRQSYAFPPKTQEKSAILSLARELESDNSEPQPPWPQDQALVSTMSKGDYTQQKMHRRVVFLEQTRDRLTAENERLHSRLAAQVPLRPLPPARTPPARCGGRLPAPEVPTSVRTPLSHLPP